MYELLQLIILFLVIFDPLISFSVFTIATANLDRKEKIKTANIAIFVAFMLSFLVLLFGENLLKIFSTNINEFKIAGGIILAILGIKLVLGYSIANVESLKGDNAKAIAVIIGTPLITGPAAITAIIVSSIDYGIYLTFIAVLISLIITAIFLYYSDFFSKYLGKTFIQISSTILGMITLSWAVNFITTGIKAIFL